jgi:ACS family tartrate transporter-like MFS transporter
MIIIGRHADHHNERRWHVASCGMCAAIGVGILCCCGSVASVLAAMCVAAIGIFGCLGPFWALATRYLRGAAAAGGIAIVNSMGALAGFAAPFAIGWAKSATGSFSIGLLVVSVSLIGGALLVLSVPVEIDRKTNVN